MFGPRQGYPRGPVLVTDAIHIANDPMTNLWQ